VESLPIVDLAAADRDAIARQIDEACRESGFFVVTGHRVPAELIARVESLAREFFALPDAEKAAVAMRHGGRAWRGWFPVGGELTSGVPDMKEGFYFGEELGPDDRRVRAGWPLHGANLFPRRPAGLRDAVLDYVDAVTRLGHELLALIARALGLDEQWFARHLTTDPVVLFRIFHYPPLADGAEGWSVGEHTDYGLITILGQDASGGLEVRKPDESGGWIAAPPVPDAFVVNLGDMLERMTGGRYRSTPHRVRNTTGVDRISFPLFLDPAWDAAVRPVPGAAASPADTSATDRWDGASVHDWSGTYGDYLLTKVGRVFPELLDEVLPTTTER
jgi:isopenicillin N synthase-like dioxygenase